MLILFILEIAHFPANVEYVIILQLLDMKNLEKTSPYCH